MLNVYEQVERNKKRSLLVMVFFVVFVSLFVWLVGQIFQTSSNLIGLAITFSLFSSLGSYFWGDKMVLKLSGAKPANKETYFTFYTVAENLSIASQIPLPSLYVIESPALNAFATGRDPDHAVICATTGLLESLDRTELEGVVAHEISHVVNYDIRLMTIVAILIGTITILSDWIFRSSRGSGSRKKELNPVFAVIGILFLIITPIAAKLIQLAISRSREYLADVSAVKLTRQPRGLISALKKLGQQPFSLRNAQSATAHLYIVNPFKGEHGFLKARALFSTHPPLEARIKSLEKMI
ncbi:M48 family metallopeptidase [Candidatus Shapirobacteria bacterium]|nr:M48 family metallopeptidase [Candidatus Shapirobacteria bacterium]